MCFSACTIPLATQSCIIRGHQRANSMKRQVTYHMDYIDRAHRVPTAAFRPSSTVTRKYSPRAEAIEGASEVLRGQKRENLVTKLGNQTRIYIDYVHTAFNDRSCKPKMFDGRNTQVTREPPSAQLRPFASNTWAKNSESTIDGLLGRRRRWLRTNCSASAKLWSCESRNCPG
jgi:hypothetical protein